MRGPSEIGTAPAAARIAARSSSVKPPSGPVRIGRRAGLEGRCDRLAAGFVGEIERAVGRVPRGSCRASPARRSRAARCARIARPPRSRCARSRSSLTRSTIVRCVITGTSRATPSSVAFSTSQSVCARLTGAKAARGPGTSSGVAGPPLDGERHALLAGLGDPRRAIRPTLPSNSSSSAPSPRRMTLPR